MFAIYEVIEKETNKKFTAKVSTVAEDAKLKVFHDILTEFSILTKFNSPFILKWYGYSLKDFENDSNPTVITEFCENGSLKNLLENRVSNSNEFNDTKKLMLIYGIASGMAHVHSKNVIHQDLKPSNIYLNEYLLPKISNF